MAYIGNQPSQIAFVTDLFNGNASTTAFTMSVAPANTASVLVAVSGVLQSPDTYSVSGTTLTFSSAPPSGTGNISTRYLGIPASGVTTTAYRTVTEFTATAGQTTFTPPSYTAGFIDVLRNGVRLGSADYTATNGTTVVLTSGAVAGDLITTVSFYVSSVLNAIPATAGSVGTTYLAAGSVTQTILGTNVAGNGPAFSAYQTTSAQSVSANTFTKITLNSIATTGFDTNSNFSTANSRFTPTVAGYYQINASLSTTTTLANPAYYNVYITKNGTTVYSTTAFPSPSNYFSAFVGGLVYCNGSTDYIEMYGQSNTAFTVQLGSSNTFLNGFLARSA